MPQREIGRSKICFELLEFGVEVSLGLAGLVVLVISFWFNWEEA